MPQQFYMICNDRGSPTYLWVDCGNGSHSPLSERYNTKTEAFETLAIYRSQEKDTMRKLKVYRITMSEVNEE